MNYLLAAVIGTALLLLQPNASRAEDAPAERQQLASEMAAPVIEFQSEEDIGLIARLHFATHTADFQSTRAFYRTLGYTQGIDDFPLTNTHQMARALGMFDICQYELADGEVMQLPGSPNPANIDLLQFASPFDDAPPYDLPNHLGMAYAAYDTSNFDRDVQTLRDMNAVLLSEPYGQPGARFVFFRDPEGVLFKLQEAAEGPQTSGEMHIFNMPYVAVNVSDLEASLAFYAMFGYTDVTPLEQTTGSLEEARAYGLDEPFKIKSADIRIERGDRHTLRLTQWLQPFNSEPAYPPPINRFGINRIALLVPDVDRAVGILKSRDVPFLSEPAPCCSGTGADTTAIVHAIDPDGSFLELVGGIQPRQPQPQPEGCPPLTIKWRTPPPAAEGASEG
jgi:catechol 2,3-dioxygenase-like lactoylglutathione lyase family enzyme